MPGESQKQFCGKSAETLGYAPAVGLEEGVQRTARWYEENRDREPANALM